MINDIINDYFSITGRPISTMTVAEYLEFKKFAGQESSTSSVRTEIPVQKNITIQQKPQNSEKPKTEQIVNKPSNTGNVLEMLRSVKG